MVDPSSVTEPKGSPEKLLAGLWLLAGPLQGIANWLAELGLLWVGGLLVACWGPVAAAAAAVMGLLVALLVARGATVATPFIVVRVFTVVDQSFLVVFTVFYAVIKMLTT